MAPKCPRGAPLPAEAPHLCPGHECPIGLSQPRQGQRAPTCCQHGVYGESPCLPCKHHSSPCVLEGLDHSPAGPRWPVAGCLGLVERAGISLPISKVRTLRWMHRSWGGWVWGVRDRALLLTGHPLCARRFTKPRGHTSSSKVEAAVSIFQEKKLRCRELTCPPLHPPTHLGFQPRSACCDRLWS